MSNDKLTVERISCAELYVTISKYVHIYQLCMHLTKPQEKEKKNMKGVSYIVIFATKYLAFPGTQNEFYPLTSIGTYLLKRKTRYSQIQRPS